MKCNFNAENNWVLIFKSPIFPLMIVKPTKSAAALQVLNLKNRELLFSQQRNFELNNTTLTKSPEFITSYEENYFINNFSDIFRNIINY